MITSVHDMHFKFGPRHAFWERDRARVVSMCVCTGNIRSCANDLSAVVIDYACQGRVYTIRRMVRISIPCPTKQRDRKRTMSCQSSFNLRVQGVFGPLLLPSMAV